MGRKLIYCPKCGAQNPDTAVYCSNCGTQLYAANPQDWHSHRQSQRHIEHAHSTRNSGIGLLIAGLIVIALGLTLLYGDWFLFWTYFWPIALVVLGIWLLIRALRWSQRRYR